MAALNGMFLSHELGGHDPRFPSFFEVFMQDRIDMSLKPAARHVCLVLAERFPRAIHLLEHFEEVFALLRLLLERHYLGKADALLSETLYGFRRALFSARRGGEAAMAPLGAKDRRAALLLTVFAPYVKAKLDALYAHWSATLPSRDQQQRRGRRRRRQQRRERTGQDDDDDEEVDEEEVEEDARTKLRRAFVAMYPVLHVGYEGSFFAYQWAYLLGHTRHYSPLLHLAGQALRRVTREDVEQQPLPGEDKSLGTRVVRSLKVAVVLAVVAFKVAEWWMATPEMALTGGGRQRIVPPVPDPPTAAPNGVPLPKDPTLCPLCRQPRVNPAVTPAGVAYCYRCLLAHVRDAGAFCPVTLQGCREEQVRRVFLS